MDKAQSGTTLGCPTPPRTSLPDEGGPFAPVSTTEEESRLRQNYVFEDAQEVGGFLDAHPGVAAALRDALPQVEKFFGEDAGITLRVVSDQESDPSLSARVRTALGWSEARAARKAFNVAWWMRQTDAEELPLTFSLELL